MSENGTEEISRILKSWNGDGNRESAEDLKSTVYKKRWQMLG